MRNLASSLLEISERLLSPILRLVDLKASRNQAGILPKFVKRSWFLQELQDLLLNLRPHSNGYTLIRVGGNGDGGYLIPDDLTNIEACFSAGSDKLMDFEKHLESEYGIKSFILDKAEKKPFGLSEYQEFRDGWLGTVDDSQTVTLETWMSEAKLNSPGDFLLQMDIEGAEYKSIECTSNEVLERFRIIVIEFHNLDNFLNFNGFQTLYKPVFDKLVTSFDIVHFHANNCCGNWSLQDFDFPRVVEITFHRKDRRLTPLEQIATSSVLDRKNVPMKPDIQVDWVEIAKANP